MQLGRAGGHFPHPGRAPPFVHASERRRVQASDARPGRYAVVCVEAVELVHRGLPAEDVERVIRMVDRSEYKRRQAPPGIKISARAFGRDRRLPITNRFESSGDPAERRLRAL